MKRQIFLGIIVTAIGLCSYELESRVRKIPQTPTVQREARTDAGGQPVVVRAGNQEISAYEFSVENKRKQVIALVDKAIDYFNKTPAVEKSFNVFSSGAEFEQGELAVFVYDMEGTCWAAGHHQERIWQNFYDEIKSKSEKNKRKSRHQEPKTRRNIESQRDKKNKRNQKPDENHN